MTDTKIQGKFYPLKHSEWVKACNELTKSQLGVLYYLRSLDPYNNGIKVKSSQIAEDLGICKKAVTEAIRVLEEKQYINLEDIEYTVHINPGGIFCDTSNNVTQVGNSGNAQEILVTPEKGNSQVGNSGNTQEILVTPEKGNSRPQPKTPIQQESQIPKINKTFQDFSNTLSLEEKESFFEVGEKMAASLPRPPQLTRKWIEKNWEEVATKWRKLPQTSQVKNSKWEADPRTPVWLEEIERSGNPAQFSSKNKEKQDFVSWCWDNKKFSWLQEE
jgi:hypothetical protein